MDCDNAAQSPALAPRHFTDMLLDIQSEARRRRSLVRDWAINAEDFSDIDLCERSSTPRSTSSPANMTDRDSRASDRSDEFEYVITTHDEDDDFETVEANPHSSSSGAGSFDNDSVSESGETVETVSACGQSDAETVASVSSDLEDIQDNPNASLRFPDPISSPAATPQSHAKANSLLEQDLPPGSLLDLTGLDQDDDWSAIRDSEITIKESCGTPEYRSAEPSVDILQHQTRRTFGEHMPISQTMDKCKAKGALAGYAIPVMALALWIVCIASFSVKFGLYQVLMGTPQPHAEMSLRLQALDDILHSRGLVDSNCSAIKARDVLVYPSEGPYIRFPTVIDVKVIDNNKVFVSLPRSPVEPRYPTHPDVRILDGKCDYLHQDNCEVSILKQEDLIEGLAFILLNVPPKVGQFHITIRSERHTTLVTVGNASENAGANPDQGGKTRFPSRVISDHVKHLIDGLKSSGKNFDQALRNFVSKDNREDMKTNLLPPIRAIKTNAQEKFQASVERVHVLVSSARCAATAGLNAVHDKTSLFLQRVDAAANDIPEVVGRLGTQTEAVLGRAQRNGVMIARRIAKGIRLS